METLELPRVMHNLEKKPIVLVPPHGSPFINFPGKGLRQDIIDDLLPKMHDAQKFVFDSGSDQDLETANAVRETAVNMMEAGFFHLPYPLIWVEDPFEKGDYEEHIPGMRNFYLCEEKDNEITLIALSTFGDHGKDTPKIILNLAKIVINPAEATDKFLVLGIDRPPEPVLQKAYGEFVYALKKFIVTLACEVVDTHQVEGKPIKNRIPKIHRKYPYQIVRIPLLESHHGSSNKGITGIRRRKTLVRGYMWGKNTRSIEQQRWIKPYWRGDESLGIVEHHHYEVR